MTLKFELESKLKYVEIMIGLTKLIQLAAEKVESDTGYSNELSTNLDLLISMMEKLTEI